MRPPLEGVKVRVLTTNSDTILKAGIEGQRLRLDQNHEDGEFYALFIGKNELQYPIGKVSISNGYCDRAVIQRHMDWTQMEASAVTRLNTVLRRGYEKARIRILEETNSGVLGAHSATIVPLSIATNAPLFITELDNAGQFLVGSTFQLEVEFIGITFRFESSVISLEDKMVTWRIPRAGKRILRRAAPRNSVELRTSSTDPNNRKNPKVLDISPLGCGIESIDFTFNIWDEIEIEIPSASNGTLKVPALVIETSQNSRAGCVFATPRTCQKDVFYALHAQHVTGLKLVQNAEDAWSCLDRNGYLDLLSDDAMRQTRESCISAWKETTRDTENFHPVAYYDNKSVGTIAAVKVAKDHWIPHSLATAVGARLIKVTQALYQSWPLYILAQGEPAWFTTWYDATKAWHNRFYQVFIREHASSSQCFSFVRHYYWCPDLNVLSFDQSHATTRKLNSKIDATAIEMWQKRYHYQISPTLQLKSQSFYHFNESTDVILWGEKVVGISACLTSSLELNPVGILNVAHINIFDDELKKDIAAMAACIAGALQTLKNRGVQRCGFTTDFDSPVDPSIFKGLSLGMGRCLTSSDKHLKDLISNNALCFVDMQARYTGQ